MSGQLYSDLKKPILNRYPLVNIQKTMENIGKSPFIVDFPMNSMVMFHSCLIVFVCLPRG